MRPADPWLVERRDVIGRWLGLGRIVVLARRLPQSSRLVARERARELSAAVQSCGVGSVDHPLRISRSSSDGWAVCAAALSVPVGVDVEARPIAAPLGTDLAGLARAPGEPDGPDGDGSLARWTRKEAVLKAAGIGLALHPRRVTVGPATPTWALVDLPTGQAVQVRSLALGEEACAALAVQGRPGPVEVLIDRFDGPRLRRGPDDKLGIRPLLP